MVNEKGKGDIKVLWVLWSIRYKLVLVRVKKAQMR